MSFVRGVVEDCVPEIKLTRSRDGQSGTATFIFDNPSVFEASSNIGDITGLYMNDDEGEISTVEVQAKFINGKPAKVTQTAPLTPLKAPFALLLPPPPPSPDSSEV